MSVQTILTTDGWQMRAVVITSHTSPLVSLQTHQPHLETITKSIYFPHPVLVRPSIFTLLLSGRLPHPM